MKVNFAPNTVLPYKFIKGSAKQRNKLAEEYTERFASKLTEKFVEKGKMGRLSPEEVHGLIEDVLPAKVNFDVNEVMGENCYNAVYTLGKGEVSLKNHNIIVPLLFSDWSGVLVHEVRHFMDAITQPAMSIKRINLPKNKQDDIYNIYRKILYTDDRFSKFKKLELKDFLKKFNSEDRISILNYFRAQLQTEKNAYEQCFNYVNNKAKKHFNYVVSADPEIYKFDKKIGFVESILRKTISKQRTKIAIKNKISELFSKKAKNKR